MCCRSCGDNNGNRKALDGICKAKWDGDDAQVKDMIDHFGEYVMDMAKQFLSQGKGSQDDYKKPDSNWFKKKNK